jgi:hypothetical protein
MQHYIIAFTSKLLFLPEPEKLAMKKTLGFFVVAGTILAFGNSAFAHGAHAHGVARMNLAVEGRKVEIELETPLADVLSFEHAPETDAQKKETRDMAAVMRKADGLFIFPAEAQCRVEKVSLESEAIRDELLAPKTSGHTEKTHDGDKKDGGKSHADLDVEISFLCRHPEKLNSVTVNLFSAFPSLREVEVQMVTPKGQKAAEATPSSNIIRW